MKQIIIKEGDSGQRLDKYLGKYLKEAPKSFLYKMMRKKNTTKCILVKINLYYKLEVQKLQKMEVKFLVIVAYKLNLQMENIY